MVIFICCSLLSYSQTTVFFLIAFRSWISDQIVHLAILAHIPHSCKLHTQVDIFVAFGLGIGFKDHRHTETITLGKAISMTFRI